MLRRLIPPALLLVLCGCASVEVEKMLAREGDAMTQRQVTIGWCAPTEGPRPDYYIVRRLTSPLNARNIVAISETTEWTCDDYPGECRYTVRSVANGIESVDSLPLYRSFAVTDIRKVEQSDPDAGTVIVGILVTFATEPGCEYWLEKSTDNGATWHEIGHVLAWDTEQSIGGDASSPNAMYRVWKRL